MSAFLVWRHRRNIARLLAGTEPRLGAKKASAVRSQRGRTVKLAVAGSRCCLKPERAANAIIAPLSVQSSSSG